VSTCQKALGDLGKRGSRHADFEGTHEKKKRLGRSPLFAGASERRSGIMTLISRRGEKKSPCGEPFCIQKEVKNFYRSEKRFKTSARRSNKTRKNQFSKKGGDPESFLLAQSKKKPKDTLSLLREGKRLNVRSFFMEGISG